MPTHVALLRGVNVGGAQRLAMADLRRVIEGAGYRDVRTLLASGNAVFTASPSVRPKAATRIERGLAAELGLQSRVIVLAASELLEIVARNKLAKSADNPSRLMVVVPRAAALLEKLAPLAKQSWSPEQLVIGSRAAYVWCPAGVIDSALSKAVDRTLRDEATVRNWSTILKLCAALEGG